METLLKDADWVKWSNVQIARAASVSESLVRHLRENEDTKPATRTVERNGKTTSEPAPPLADQSATLHFDSVEKLAAESGAQYAPLRYRFGRRTARFGS